MLLVNPSVLTQNPPSQQVGLGTDWHGEDKSCIYPVPSVCQAWAEAAGHLTSSALPAASPRPQFWSPSHRWHKRGVTCPRTQHVALKLPLNQLEGGIC